MRKQPTTYLGNKELHRKHSVMIEGGAVPRARVMDQHIVDRYLMRGLINGRQHQAAEFLLGQAARAGIWPKTVNLSGQRVQGGNVNYVPFGAFPLGRTLVTVKRRFGDYHAYLVKEVVCHDYDISHSEQHMTWLKEALDWISDHRVHGGGSSLKRFRTAVRRGGLTSGKLADKKAVS